LFPRDKSAKKANNENIEHEDEMSVLRSPSSKNVTQTSFSFKPGHKPLKEKERDENSSDLNPNNRSHSMKRESFPGEGMDSKKNLTEKTPLADISAANKRLSSGKRVSGNFGVSESQKFDSLRGYQPANGNYKSMDYRNGELAKQVA
jgi:hypothetical protein